jgi:hypothetical protein
MKSLTFCIAIVAALTAAPGLMGCNNKNDTLSQVTVTPANQFMAKNSTQQFTANGTFSNGMVLNWTQVVNWSSSDKTVATVNNTAGQNGIVTSYITGTIILTAYDVANNITGTAQLVVRDPDSIQIVPPDSYIPVNGILQFTAIALFSGGSVTQVITNFATWTLSSLLSSPPTITNNYGVAGNGTVVATAVTGTAIITATYPNSPATGSTTITVTSTPLTALTVSPASATISMGTSTQFSAVGTFQDTTATPTPSLTATWSWNSSNTTVATIDYYTGIATAAAVGTTTITATDLITRVKGNTILTIQ